MRPGSACEDSGRRAAATRTPPRTSPSTASRSTPTARTEIAVNDYIAKGGSGFNVLKRNTTRMETGISLRDSLIGYMQGFCTCDDILDGPARPSKTGQRCGTLVDGQWMVDDQITQLLPQQAQAFEDALAKHAWAAAPAASCWRCPDRRLAALRREGLARRRSSGTTCSVPQGPYTGRCNCRDALGGRRQRMLRHRHPAAARPSARTPPSMAIANAVEDGRIGRRVK